ncbi:MAG: hypothetical protein H6738_08525 [Alphaproteobacteria bacterium]|nr:hypothetical protein [Alphaproteobacteria bacterium]
MIWLLAACASPPSPPRVPPSETSAEEVLERAHDALLAVSTVAYSYHFEAQGQMAMAPQVNGTASLARGPDRHSARLHVVSILSPPPQVESDEEPREMEIASDGVRVTAANHSGTKAFDGLIEEGADALIPNFGGNGLLVPYVDPDPLARERTEGRASFEGRETIDGVECDLIKVMFDDGTSVRWGIGVDDRWVRGFEEWLPGLDAASKTILRVSSLQVNPQLPPDTFVVPPREGYARERLATHLAVGATFPPLELHDTEGHIVKVGGSTDMPTVVVLGSTQDLLESAKAFASVDRITATDARVLAVDLPALETGAPNDRWTAANHAYPLLVGADDATLQSLRARMPGLIYVVDTKGIVRFAHTHAGAVPASELDAAIAAAR